ncbi:MAG: hypothetical protein KGH69_04820 [Candidatus Micrarchaeota archaeon]|nr:hypothetical protein [Candidatus Micrarchaeota archaeon]
MADEDPFAAASRGSRNYVTLAAAVAVIAVVAISAYYLLSSGSSPQATTTTVQATVASTLPAYGGNASAQAISVSPNIAFAINTSYMQGSSVNYSQVQSLQYTSPLYYGPGAKTAYDSMVGNPQFESLAQNDLPIDAIAAKYPNTILEMWAYAETFNTNQNASGMFDYFYSTHTGTGQSVPTQISPQIGDNSILITYDSVAGQFAPMNLYMVLFVYNDTFAQIGAWMPKNSTPDQAISVARAYAARLKSARV